MTKTLYRANCIYLKVLLTASRSDIKYRVYAAMLITVNKTYSGGGGGCRHNQPALWIRVCMNPRQFGKPDPDSQHEAGSGYASKRKNGY